MGTIIFFSVVYFLSLIIHTPLQFYKMVELKILQILFTYTKIQLQFKTKKRWL
jgi:hypothetical protein